MVGLLHVSITLVAILREVYYEGYITKRFEQMHKWNILGFKIYGLKYILKYKIQIKFNLYVASM
jgi:hypothetical protein